jgi:hypothetical protein
LYFFNLEEAPLPPQKLTYLSEHGSSASHNILCRTKKKKSRYYSEPFLEDSNFYWFILKRALSSHFLGLCSLYHSYFLFKTEHTQKHIHKTNLRQFIGKDDSKMAEE